MALTANDYQRTIDVQSACNLSGVVHSFSEVLHKIFDECKGKGTKAYNEHAICRLYAEQIAHLTRGKDYSDAYEECFNQSQKKGGE